jgi:hypothetical protein
MDPITLAIMAGTGISSVLGGIGANNANKQNAQIAMLNYMEQVRARQRAEMEARRQQSEAKLGTTDASGNRTMFVPGRGWVTVLTDEQQAIQDESEAEMLRQLREEADRNETVSARAATRRDREDVLATEGERAFRAERRPDEDALRQLLLARGAETRNQSADRSGEIVARQNLRSGSRNAAELLQGARAASDATGARQAGIEAALMANDEADRRFDAGRSRGGQMYDYYRRMSTSGTAAPTPYQPQGPQTRGTGVADQGIINVMARPVERDYTNANLAVPDTISDITGMLGSWQQMRQNDALFNAIRDRYGSSTGAVK